jgi:glycosyltransferase involved in cell wall biosynthesis
LHDGIAHPIVVVNGALYRPETLAALQRRDDLTCLYLDRGDHCAARLVGRLAVQTEFFGMLDDDDEYLPGALRYQQDHIEEADVLITNGYEHLDGHDRMAFSDLAVIRYDPIYYLLRDSWVHGGGALYRTARVPAHYFKTPHSMELTYTALKLALSRTLKFDNTVTFRWHHRTPESLSAKPSWQGGEPEALQWMMALTKPFRFQCMLAKKYAASLHRISNAELLAGRLGSAWKWHLRSLGTWYGWRYLTYTRRLFLAKRPHSVLKEREDP